MTFEGLFQPKLIYDSMTSIYFIGITASYCHLVNTVKATNIEVQEHFWSKANFLFLRSSK